MGRCWMQRAVVSPEMEKVVGMLDETVESYDHLLSRTKTMII